MSNEMIRLTAAATRWWDGSDDDGDGDGDGGGNDDVADVGDGYEAEGNNGRSDSTEEFISK
jgi:hypothetical protein